jgi:hypothetical protein
MCAAFCNTAIQIDAFPTSVPSNDGGKPKALIELKSFDTVGELTGAKRSIILGRLMARKRYA